MWCPSNGEARTGARGAAAVIQETTGTHQVPRALETYPSAATESLAAELAARVQSTRSTRWQRASSSSPSCTRLWLPGLQASPTGSSGRRTTDGPGARSSSLRAEALHFLGEVEVVFGLWAVVLLAAITLYTGWESAAHYVNDTVNLHRAAVRRRHHGARVDSTDGGLRGVRAAPGGECRRRDAGGVVGRQS